MSREGIIEIADLENNRYEMESQGLVGVFSLRIAAIMSLVMTIIAFIFASFMNSPQFFKYYFGFGLVLYILCYLTWNKAYLIQQFRVEETVLIKKEKRISLIIFLVSFSIGAVLYGYL